MAWGSSGGAYNSTSTSAYGGAAGHAHWLNQASSTTSAMMGGWNSSATTTSSGASYVGLAVWTDEDTISAQQAMWQSHAQRMYLQGQQMSFAEVQREVDRQYTQRQQFAAEAEANRRYVEAQKGRDEAAKRAQELLLEHLTPEQRESVKANKWFVVEGGKSKKQYRIWTRSVAGNIEELAGNGKVVARYCCHADGSIPCGDQHLTQKLTLEYDEEHFLKRANRTPMAA